MHKTFNQLNESKRIRVVKHMMLWILRTRNSLEINIFCLKKIDMNIVK